MRVPVVRIITRLNIGGPSIQAAMLTDRLESHDFHTHLVHGRLGPGEGDMSYLLTGAGESISQPWLQRELAPMDDVRALRAIYALLCKVRPRIVHTHMAKAGALGRTAAMLYNRTAGRRQPTRIVHTYHGHVLEGYFGRRKASAFLSIERTLARITDRLIAISPAIRGELVSRYHIGRDAQYAVVPLGFELANFARIDSRSRHVARAAMGIAQGQPTIATVGRLTAIKQHELLLQATRHLVDHRRDLLLLIVGDGERRAELEAMTQTLQLTGNVRFLGWRRDLEHVYAATNVFVLTSRNEGTPVALIEAMASGVVGVSTDVGGVGDVIVDGTVGTRVNEMSADRIAAAVEHLLADPTRRETMGQRARTLVLSRYTAERLVNDIALLYRQLLG
jgi:glycosyltransferase involved in cell wall biosynthesis